MIYFLPYKSNWLARYKVELHKPYLPIGMVLTNNLFWAIICGSNIWLIQKIHDAIKGDKKSDSEIV